MKVKLPLSIYLQMNYENMSNIWEKCRSYKKNFQLLNIFIVHVATHTQTIQDQTKINKLKKKKNSDKGKNMHKQVKRTNRDDNS